MARNAGYQKKREWVRVRNPAFFKPGLEVTKEKLYTEWTRLQLIDQTAQKEAARAAEEERERLAIEDAKRKANEERAQKKLRDQAISAGDAFEASGNVTFKTIGDHENQTKDTDDWAENGAATASATVFGDESATAAFGSADEWTQTASQDPSQAIDEFAQSVTANDEWGNDAPFPVEEVPDDGQGAWTHIPKRPARITKPKAEAQDNPRGCFNCGGDHKKSECTEPPKDTRTCRKCNEEGHIASNCTNAPTSGGGRSGGCRKCGEEGHYASECPNNDGDAAGGSNGQGCFNCGSTDHIKRDCPQGGSGGGSTRECYGCGEVGHMRSECLNGQSGQRSGRACYNCGQEGHMSRDCDQPRQEGQGARKGRGTCYACGETGHRRDNCPNGGGTGYGNSQKQGGRSFGQNDGFEAADFNATSAGDNWATGGDAGDTFTSNGAGDTWAANGDSGETFANNTDSAAKENQPTATSNDHDSGFASGGGFTDAW